MAPTVGTERPFEAPNLGRNPTREPVIASRIPLSEPPAVALLSQFEPFKFGNGGLSNDEVREAIVIVEWRLVSNILGGAQACQGRRGLRVEGSASGMEPIPSSCRDLVVAVQPDFGTSPNLEALALRPDMPDDCRICRQFSGLAAARVCVEREAAV